MPQYNQINEYMNLQIQEFEFVTLKAIQKEVIQYDGIQHLFG